MTGGAVLLTIVLPFIALIAALLMLGVETRPTRMRFLRSWAMWSGGVLAGWLVVGLMLSLTVIGGDECRGGRQQFGLPTYTQTGGSDSWVVTYPCAEGGHTSSPVPEPFADQAT